MLPLFGLFVVACMKLGDRDAMFPFAVMAFVLAVWVMLTLYWASRVVQWVIDGFWNPRIEGFVQEELEAHNACLGGARFRVRDMVYDLSEGTFTLRYQSAEGDPGVVVIRNVTRCDCHPDRGGEQERELAGMVVHHKKDEIVLWATDFFAVRLRLSPPLWDVTITRPTSEDLGHRPGV